MVKNKTCLAVVLTVKHYRKELQSFCWHLSGSRGIQGKSYLLLLKAGEFERGKIGPFISDFTWILRVQRKLILPLALRASCNQHLLAQKSFLLAWKSCLCRFHFVGAIFGLQEFIRNLKHLYYSTFVILILRKIFACPSGKLSTEFTSPIAKSTSPRLSDTTFFARWFCLVHFISQLFNKKLFQHSTT